MNFPDALGDLGTLSWNGSGFNHDPLWLISGVAAYIKESGDEAILDVQVPFDHDAANAGTLLEHLRRSFRHVLKNLGPHGLPLIGRADRNDCLNLNWFGGTPGGKRTNG